MTWQDELQTLDAELAAGRISAEEYRQRRDNLLSKQQSSESDDPTKTVAPVEPTGEEPTRQVEPIAGEEPTKTVGPVTGEETTKQVGPVTGEETTTTVKPVTGEEPTAQGGPTAATQTPAQAPKKDPFPPAFSWSDAARQANRPHGAGQESTQVVRPQTPPPPNWGPPQPPPAPWPQQQPRPPQWGPVETTGTPWGDDLPGSTSSPNAPWMRQGPEVFEKAGHPGRGKLIAAVSLIVVVVLAVIVGVVLWLPHGSNQASQQRPVAPPPPPPAPATSTTPQLPEAPPPGPIPANTQAALVAVPGPPHPWNGLADVLSLQTVKASLVQPREVLDTAFQNGLVEAWFNGTDGVVPRTSLLALKMPDSGTAKTVVDKYVDAQKGLTPVDALSYKGVPVFTGGGVFRTAYVSYNYAIILEVGGDPVATGPTQDAFKALLDQQLLHTPPTVRQ